MMKTLALLVPPDLREDGRLLPCGAQMLCRLVEQLGQAYRITLILRALRGKAYEGLPEGVPVLLDADEAELHAQTQPTYMQRGLAAWAEGAPLPGSWDCAVALDGLHPWCLATALRRVTAARRLAYLPCEPAMYLAPGDASAFGAAYGALDGVLCGSRWTQEGFGTMFPQVRSVLAHPPHEAPAVEAGERPEAGRLHILTVEPLTPWRQAERIPALAAAVREACPALRWHILGEGPRYPHLLREIILQDVCGEVFPSGASNRMNALLPYSSGVVHFDDENDGAAAAAQALGIPVLSLRREEGAQRLAAWLASLRPADEPRQPVWQDGAVWTKMIEGE